MSGQVLGETRERDRRQPPRGGFGGRATCSTGLSRHGARADVRTIGMGLPAPITTTSVLSSAILPGWEGVDARAAATAALRRGRTRRERRQPRALAEHRRGLGRGHDNVGLREGVLRGRRRAHPRQRDLPRHQRHGRRDRAPHARRPGAAVPLRQPRLPGGVRLDGHRAGDDERAAARRRVDDIIAAAQTATSRRCASSRTPACTSAGGSRASPTWSTPGSSWSAATCPTPATCCSSPARPACAVTCSTRSPRRRSSSAKKLGERASLVGAVQLAAEHTVLVVD